MDDVYFMTVALKEAEKSMKHGDVPVGCVIVRNGKILSKSGNGRESRHDATGHAELTAIKKACRKLHGWHLTDCTLYVTLEPCPMCAGAIINSRIDRVVYGALNRKCGAISSKERIFENGYNHTPEITAGVLEKECSDQLTAFFSKLRRADD